jgi:hypothetical protein
MKKTVIRVLLAAAALTLTVMAQHGGVCGGATNKQDCQDCCVATKQAAFKACPSGSGKQACLSAAQDAFNSCMDACKSLPLETGPGEPGTNPQGN